MMSHVEGVRHMVPEILVADVIGMKGCVKHNECFCVRKLTELMIVVWETGAGYPSPLYGLVVPGVWAGLCRRLLSLYSI